MTMTEFKRRYNLTDAQARLFIVDNKLENGWHYIMEEIPDAVKISKAEHRRILIFTIAGEELIKSKMRKQHGTNIPRMDYTKLPVLQKRAV